MRERSREPDRLHISGEEACTRLRRAYWHTMASKPVDRACRTELLKGAEGILSRGAVKFVYAEFNHLMPREGIAGGSLLELDEILALAGLRFVASYTDFTDSEGVLFAGCNARFAPSRN